MTDIVFYDGKTPVHRNGKMIPHQSNIQIEIQGDDTRETIYVKYGDILDISKTGEESRIEFASAGEKYASQVIVFTDPQIHKIIYNNWGIDKQNILSRSLVVLKGLSNFKKIILSVVILPAVLFTIFQILNKTYIFLPLSLDKELGSGVAKNFLNSAELIKNKAMQNSIEHLTKNIIPKNSPYNYKITIIKNPAANAFALPGGDIFIFSGLINQARSPDEIAGVLAHEISHVEMRHGIRQLIRVLGMSYMISSVIGAGLEGLDVSETLSEIANILIYYKYSREFEKEADIHSIKLLQNAGISTGGLIKFLERLSKRGDMPDAMSWINTHPNLEVRAKYLKEESEQRNSLRVGKRILIGDKEWQALKTGINN